MSNLYNVSASPHIKDNISTKAIMADVCIAMLPAVAFSIYNFGIKALILILTTVASAVLAEYFYQKLMKKSLTVSDFSAVVTGLILALNLPVNFPLWQAIIGSIFAIVVVKQVYGGLGQNFMNPALAARAFLLISFAKTMTDFSSEKLGFDAMSSATPLALLKSGDLFIGNKNILFDMFIGNTAGTLGEVSVLALLIGAIYMLIKRVISLRIPLTYILTVAIFVFVFGKQDITYVLAHVFGGGLFFGAFFMATDYASSPINAKGQYVFAFILGILTAVFRLFGASAEGVSYAIIIGNMLSPLIEKYTLRRIKIGGAK